MVPVVNITPLYDRRKDSVVIDSMYTTTSSKDAAPLPAVDRSIPIIIHHHLSSSTAQASHSPTNNAPHEN
jgi:hypothetical protein